MTILIWYPKCSTCQKAKKKLEELKVPFTLRHIVDETPSMKELQNWMKLGGLELKQLYNTSGNLYKALNMKEKRKEMSEEEQLQLLSENGMLLKRPILVGEHQVLVGYRENAYEEFVRIDAHN